MLGRPFSSLQSTFLQTFKMRPQDLISRTRKAFSLIEMVVVLAILALLAAIAYPTLSSTEGDRPIKAGGDLIRSKLAEARAAAIEEGTTYRFAISPDGRSVRFAPDNDSFNVNPSPDSEIVSEENELPKKVTARVINDEASEATVDSNGWTRVATFQPDGTCREAVVEIEISQPGTYKLIIRLRGLTGNTQTFKRKADGSVVQ